MITRTDPEYAAADERSTLESFLEWYRASLVLKATGVSEEAARTAACPPSDLTLLGLVRHAAEVERNWFHRRLLGTDPPHLYLGDAHPDGDPDGDFHAPPGATLAEAIATWSAEVADARVQAARFALDDESARDRVRGDGTTFRPTLRWIYVHLIEEYARHCGHADLLRQRLDGATGE